jgi:hypothetical protein
MPRGVGVPWVPRDPGVPRPLGPGAQAMRTWEYGRTRRPANNTGGGALALHGCLKIESMQRTRFPLPQGEGVLAEAKPSEGG